jgi:hypothetical protein
VWVRCFRRLLHRLIFVDYLIAATEFVHLRGEWQRRCSAVSPVPYSPLPAADPEE